MLYRLRESGYQAYLVGGGVRDLLLGREPKDFDIVTDAEPEQIRGVFRNCRLIGRRFRLAHVRFGRDVIEVATFRAAAPPDAAAVDGGQIVSDNVYGSMDEDALRRDFSINALYYNIADFSLVDYANGLEDLREGRIRMLGDPEQRYREDPVRMLRAVRFAAKLGFVIEPATEAPIAHLAPLLADIPPARLFEELLKLFLYGGGLSCFEKLRHYGLFAQLFPDTDDCLALEEEAFPLTLVRRGLENTDRRVQEGKPVTPAFLFAVLLWEPVRQRAAQLIAAGMERFAAYELAADEVLARQVSRVAIPRRFSAPMREIWLLQLRFNATGGKRPARLAAHPRFRAAYDFLVLRAAAGEADEALAEWWTQYQEGQPAATKAAPAAEDAAEPRKRRRRRRRRPASARSAGAEVPANARSDAEAGSSDGDDH